jgi:hypothetical protein
MPRGWTPIVRHVIQARPTAQAQLTAQVEAYDFHEAPPRFKFRPTAREASLCQSASATENNNSTGPVPHFSGISGVGSGLRRKIVTLAESRNVPPCPQLGKVDVRFD